MTAPIVCCIILSLIATLVLSTPLPQPTTYCQPQTTISVRRQLEEDGVLSVSVYAGHRRRHMGAHVVWSPHQVDPRWGTFVLTGKELAAREDLPEGWYDGKSALTMERLVFFTRGHERSWPASTDPKVPSTLLNLSPYSPLWLTHSAVVFSGQLLHFIPWKAGHLCNAVNALDHLADNKRHLTLWADSPTLVPLTVYSQHTGDVIATWNVTVSVNPDMDQTLILSDAFAVLGGPHANHLLTLGPGKGVALLTSKEAAEQYLAGPLTPSFSATITGHGKASNTPELHRVIFGRRMLQQKAASLAVDSHGQMAVRLVTLDGVPPPQKYNVSTLKRGVMESDIDDDSTTTGTDAVSLGVRWLAFVVGVILAFLTAFWSTQLGPVLKLGFRVQPTGRDVHIHRGYITTADLLWGWLALIFSVIGHVLMVVYTGHDVQADASLETDLKTFSLTFAIPSLFVGLLFVIILLTESARWLHSKPQMRQVVSLQLYAIVIGLVASRGVMACLLVTAGSSLLQLGVAVLIGLVLVLFPCAYGFFLLGITLLSGQGLSRINPSRMSSVANGLEVFGLVLTLGLVVVLAFSIPLWLLYPFLNLSNALYDAMLIQAANLFAGAFPIAAAAFSLNMQVKVLVDRVKKER